jgi:hypothetical protein
MFNLNCKKPYGILRTQGMNYFLLKPDPVPGDSWEGDNTYRFVGVPIHEIAWEENGKSGYSIYDYARHIVTNAFTIEYQSDLDPIHFKVLPGIDLTLQESIKEKDNDEEKDEYIDF